MADLSQGLGMTGGGAGRMFAAPDQDTADVWLHDNCVDTSAIYRRLMTLHQRSRNLWHDPLKATEAGEADAKLRIELSRLLVRFGRMARMEKTP